MRCVNMAQKSQYVNKATEYWTLVPVVHTTGLYVALHHPHSNI